LTGDSGGALPPQLLRSAEEFLAAAREPAVPKDAATVVLLRQTRSGPQAYLLRRHSRMGFAAGMYVFPGGTVDDLDFDETVPWAGPGAARFAAALKCDPATAHALVCAAVRETFEESGVLLAGPSAAAAITDTGDASWERDRAALVDRELSFGELLRRRSLLLRADLLAPWAHWITPEFEPRRYDTRFFVAALPRGQTPRDVSGEADRVSWRSPEAAQGDADAGRIAMLPPTYETLRELAQFSSVESVIQAAEHRVIAAVLPGARLVDGRVEVTWKRMPT
jgi:8-oxo-dGTP pyrophosphatase MutT (NUDIX family)